MGKMVELTAGDGHTLQAYRADPQGTARGAVVIVQEIFGVNSHIRSVADGYAAEGYVAIAPALFDRTERGLELGYEGDDVARGRDIAFPLGWDGPTADIAASVDAVKDAGAGGATLKVGVVGYCWGGSLAFVAACRLPVDAAVGYYGGQIVKFMEANPSEKPVRPVMLHFGKQDAGIPMESVEQIGAAFGEVPIHLYDAGHGFSCDQRASFDAPASTEARGRTLEFFAEHLQA